MDKKTWFLPEGFLAGAGHGGLKPEGQLDVALLISERPCNGAAVFTRNKFAAAPVQYDRVLCRQAKGRLHGVVINAGNANAVTGAAGLQQASAMAHFAAEQCQLPANSLCVMSTGVIGVPLPLDQVQSGIVQAQADLSNIQVERAARAIMTTDTQPKWAGVTVRDGARQPVGVVSGIAKGAGMIHPNMATMLAVILTDLAVSNTLLPEILGGATETSFNRISVDGDTSTNDTVILLANGAAGNVPIDDASALLPAFRAAVQSVARSLAQQIVRDGEGATKFVTIQIRGAANDQEAVQVARAIANSPLCKTAFYGEDANWGRILAAAGYSGAQISPQRVALWFSNRSGDEIVQVLTAGVPADYQEEEVARIFAHPEITLRLDLGIGAGKTTFWTSDLSHDYVTINGSYRS